MNTTCPYCRAEIATNDLYSCPGCTTPHHKECWVENQGCTLHGCTHRPPDEAEVSITNEQATVSSNTSPTPNLTQGINFFPAQQQASPLQQTPSSSHPGNHLLPLSIVTTILCCTAFYFGIIAIYYSMKIDNYMQTGDYYNSHAAANKAALWCWATVGVGLPLNLIGLLFLTSK